jgi:hypothetical protein
VATFAHFYSFVCLLSESFLSLKRKMGSGVMSNVNARDATRNDRPPRVGATIRDLPPQQRGGTPRRSDDNGGQASSLMERVTLESTFEIDRLIDDLNKLRQRLEDEGNRLQRDLADHSSFSQSVIQLTNIVSDSMAQVKMVSDAPSIDTKVDIPAFLAAVERQ